ncbi:hypothetical protein GW17_00031646 [Ensete ventricosum]|nr:hypothetical protein GW17_00031646 [Ensete ventricosum]
MGTDPPENPEAQRPSPPRAAKPDGDAASETSSAQSSEPSDRRDAESLVLLQDFNCALHENILLQVMLVKVSCGLRDSLLSPYNDLILFFGPEVRTPNCQKNLNLSLMVKLTVTFPLGFWKFRRMKVKKMLSHYLKILFHGPLRTLMLLQLVVEDFFSLFVSDHAADFLKDFHTRGGDKVILYVHASDFQCTSWHRHEQFGYTRNVSFLHPVKVYLGMVLNLGTVRRSRNFACIETGYRYAVGTTKIDCRRSIEGEKGKKKNKKRKRRKKRRRESIPRAVLTHVSLAGRPAHCHRSCLRVAREPSSPSLVIFLPRGEKDRGDYQVSYRTELSSIRWYRLYDFTGKIEQSTREECKEVYATWMSIAHETLKEKNIGQFKAGLAEQDASMLSIILLLARVPEVHLVTHGNYNMENVEWLEKRFNYLKEEMLMVESRLEHMRHEYALLKSYLQSLEQLRAQ